jgi:branched-chain amino acid transport system substrate-binding protein
MEPGTTTPALVSGSSRPWTQVVSGFHRTRTDRFSPIWIFVLLALVCAAKIIAAQNDTSAPIKIGFMVPLSGGNAQNGRDILNGFLMYLDEIGYRAGGRRIELIVEDDEAIPAVGLTKARKLVERDEVHVMAGALLSSTGYALAPYITSMKIPMVYPVVSADDLTQRRRSDWIVRTGWSGSQPNHAFGEYAHRTLGIRSVVTVALDYAFGWESVGGFERTFVDQGGRIRQKIWVPISVHDFAPYLAQIPRDVDAVYALLLGRSALQFMRQYQEFGLKGRVRLIGGGTTTDEHVLPFMGDEAIGTITALHYSAALDTPANKVFAQAYRTRYKKVPSYYSESMYTGGKYLVAAINAIGGRVEDRQALVDALRQVKPEGLPRGPVELDAYGNPIENVYVRRVERVNGQLQNTVIDTFPKVSQFWNYDPSDYLRQPLYAR